MWTLEEPEPYMYTRIAMLNCYVIDWDAAQIQCMWAWQGGVTWVKCTYLGLLGELRDDKAGFSSDDSVDHHFQTWAIIVSIHSCVVAYCVAVTGICMHAWTSLKGHQSKSIQFIIMHDEQVQQSWLCSAIDLSSWVSSRFLCYHW